MRASGECNRGANEARLAGQLAKTSKWLKKFLRHGSRWRGGREGLAARAPSVGAPVNRRSPLRAYVSSNRATLLRPRRTETVIVPNDALMDERRGILCMLVSV
ncbi:unnamed protein product, partial [Iphiclides podalirius]